jgi:hypothetical protein
LKKTLDKNKMTGDNSKKDFFTNNLHWIDLRIIVFKIA